MRIPIPAKLGGSFGLLVAILAVISWVAVSRLSTVAGAAVRGSQATAQMQQVSNLRNEIANARWAVTEYFQTVDGPEAQPATSPDASAESQLETATTSLRTIRNENGWTASQTSALTGVGEQWGKYTEAVADGMALAKSGDTKAAVQAAAAADRYYQNVQAEIESVQAEVQAAGDTNLADAKNTAKTSRVVILVLAIVGSLVAATFAAISALSIVRRAKRMSFALRRMSEGDLSVMVVPGENDELGDMACSYASRSREKSVELLTQSSRVSLDQPRKDRLDRLAGILW